jgi:ribokinase
MALICTDRRGQNSIVVSPGANARLTPGDVARNARLVRSAQLVLLQLEIPLATVLAVVELAATANVPVMLDPAPARELPRRILELVTWLTPNESEALALCDRASASDAPIALTTARQLAVQLQKRGPRNVIVTLGHRGCCVADATGGVRLYPAFRVRTVDSTAAGDAFNAGLAVGLSRGRPLPEAVRYGSAVAALAVTRPGAQPSMPGARAVASFLRRFSR